tara:strand:+ start:23 stop:184 length:162 start_codon:yes stop_codon:yes gene_type:complete
MYTIKPKNTTETYINTFLVKKHLKPHPLGMGVLYVYLIMSIFTAIIKLKEKSE